MNPDQRRTIESILLSSTKTPPNNKQPTESNTIISSTLSSTESESPISPLSASSCSGDQTKYNIVSETSLSSFATPLSLNESFEAKFASNDISISGDVPRSEKLEEK